MTLTSLAPNNRSLVQENLYQVALTAGRVIWVLPFLVAALAGFLVVSPLWLGEKIALMLLADANASGEGFDDNEEQSF
ncbi:MAG: hypothetical protein ACRDEA_16595 [Microcystaceae cyanobacterium]